MLRATCYVLHATCYILHSTMPVLRSPTLAHVPSTSRARGHPRRSLGDPAGQAARAALAGPHAGWEEKRVGVGAEPRGVGVTCISLTLYLHDYTSYTSYSTVLW